MAKVYDKPKSSHVLYQVEGQWNGVSKYVKEVPTYCSTGQIFLDQTEEKHQVITVEELSKQGPLESRKVWKDVADGIRKGDFESASAAKSKLEASRLCFTILMIFCVIRFLMTFYWTFEKYGG